MGVESVFRSMVIVAHWFLQNISIIIP